MSKAKWQMMFIAALTALSFCGCADPVVFGEVFQLEKGQEICTKYNIWYDDPQDISCLNIQHGGFIPVGTVIEPLGTDGFMNRIRFKVKSTGKEFAIKFNESYRLCTMRDYIAYTFAVNNPLDKLEVNSEQAKKVRERIIRGEVVPGMNEKALLLTYGPPPACRTNDLHNGSWIYWRTPTLTMRVVLRNDKVRSLINVGQEI